MFLGGILSYFVFLKKSRSCPHFFGKSLIIILSLVEYFGTGKKVCYFQYIELFFQIPRVIALYMITCWFLNIYVKSSIYFNFSEKVTFSPTEGGSSTSESNSGLTLAADLKNISISVIFWFFFFPFHISDKI